MLERRGVISGYEGSKPRQVLIGEGEIGRIVTAGDGEPVAARASLELVDDDYEE
jgi:S-DNA-T family DNA segregation ATPase FtsK/SpoIIIE